jgi:hypothetical protein
VKIQCAPTARWYATSWLLIALLFTAIGVLFLIAAWPDPVAFVLAAGFTIAAGVIVAVALRACLTHVTIRANSDGICLDAPAYFTRPVTIPREKIYGAFFGTRPLTGPGSARHTALVISFPRTNLGIRFTDDLQLPEARAGWSALVNNAFLRPRGNSCLVPAPGTLTRGILIRVDKPQDVASQLAQLLRVDTGAIW